MKIIAVIGKNFGDEGKGLVTASLCSYSDNNLIIKHNGGAQAGHTVETELFNSRFVHHQIGSGAEYGAATLFAASYMIDLFQLGKEMSSFNEIFGFYPALYSEADTCITIIDDVLINMATETQRGDKRHGSCGMGINECFERNKADYRITISDILVSDTDSIANKLENIRKNYSIPRAKALKLNNESEYFQMLNNDSIIINFAAEIKKNAEFIKIVNADYEWLSGFKQIIFETGQGLLLDKDCVEYAPHLTSSKTGLSEPLKFLKKRYLSLDEAIYVTRPYVTRHGAGPLNCECSPEEIAFFEHDSTNEPNEWQGKIRYAKHRDFESFTWPIFGDIGNNDIKPSICITHLNETDGYIIFEEGQYKIDELTDLLLSDFQNIYTSYNHTSVSLL